jgi:Pyridoxamine 5'-phosphate oxidase like
MLHDKNLHFISSRIQDIGVALLSNQSSDVLKMPTTLVKTLQVDDDGNVWLFIPRPKQQLHFFSQHFPVILQYFKKGKDYYLNISGKALIVNDPEIIGNLPGLEEDKKIAALTEQVLIKVKILKAEYFEHEKTSHYQKLWSNFLDKLFWKTNSKRQYELA